MLVRAGFEYFHAWAMTWFSNILIHVTCLQYYVAFKLDLNGAMAKDLTCLLAPFYNRIVTSTGWCTETSNQRTSCLEAKRKMPLWKPSILGCLYFLSQVGCNRIYENIWLVSYNLGRLLSCSVNLIIPLNSWVATNSWKIIWWSY